MAYGDLPNSRKDHVLAVISPVPGSQHLDPMVKNFLRLTSRSFYVYFVKKDVIDELNKKLGTSFNEAWIVF